MSQCRMNVIPIAFAFDNNLVFPACICISSLLMNADKDTYYDIYILHSIHEQLETSELDRLPEHYGNCSITYRMVDTIFDNSYEIRGITSPAYYRLLIPEVIPEYDKILYSDVDVIFRSDLKHFYDENIDNYYFAGVDVNISLRPDILKYARDVIKIDVSKGYYYSGNLLINSKKIIQDGLIIRFKELARMNFKFQDLDIINITCNGSIKPLTPEFCLTNYFYELCNTQREQLDRVYSSDVINHILKYGIVHYNGAKPWKGWCYNQDIWWDYYRRSIYFSERLCYEFYSERIKEIDNWPLLKRLRHLLRFFLS